MTDSERIVFVGGPMDGLEQTRTVGESLLRIPVQVEGDDHDTLHDYVQADFLTPPQEPAFSASGARRYVYLGQSKSED